MKRDPNELIDHAMDYVQNADRNAQHEADFCLSCCSETDAATGERFHARDCPVGLVGELLGELERRGLFHKDDRGAWHPSATAAIGEPHAEQLRELLRGRLRDSDLLGVRLECEVIRQEPRPGDQYERYLPGTHFHAALLLRSRHLPPKET